MKITNGMDALGVPEAVATFASNVLNERLGNADDNDPGQLFRQAWPLCGSFGLLGMHLDPLYGGRGTSVETAVTAMEALGEYCDDAGFAFAVNVALFSHASTLAACASDSQKKRYLAPLCAGESVCAYALSEETAGSDIYALTTSATAVNGGYRLSGTKTYVSLGPVADFALVFATTDATKGQWGLTVFIVDLDLPGVTIDSMPKGGLSTTPMGTITLDDCFVSAEQVLGRPGTGAAIFEESQIWERSFVLASQVGAMRRQLNEALAHARDRSQFGQPIGKFQSVSNRLADMRLRIETAHLLVQHVAKLRDAGRPTRIESALVKLHLSECFFASSVDAVRVHAGSGYSGKALAMTDLRDSVGGLLLGGTNDIQRNIISRLMGV